jgi:hypothetical protein
MISFSLIRGVGKPFAIFWNCRPSMRSVASKAVVNSHSPAARLWSTTANPVAIHFQSAVGHPFDSVIAAFLPRLRKLRRTVELTQAPVLRTFSSPYGGHVWRLICNLLPVQVHTGQCFSFLCSCVQACKQARGSFTNRLEVSPVLSFAPTDHAHKKAWRRTHDEQRNPASGA